MPLPRRLPQDSEFSRSQEHYHLHRILESVTTYNKCNAKRRRLMVIHVDEREDYRIMGAYGTPSMVGCALTSGLFSTLDGHSDSFAEEKVANYLPYLCAPDVCEVEEAPADVLQASIMELLFHVSWPNCEVFSYHAPLGWPSTMPFRPLYQDNHDRNALLEIYFSLYAAYYWRINDLSICTHTTDCAGEIHHFGACSSFSPVIQKLMGSPRVVADKDIKFDAHRMYVGCRGVGFEHEKKQKEGSSTENKVALKRKRKSPAEVEDSPDLKLFKQIQSLKRKNAYSTFVAENYGRIEGTFTERNRRLAEMWKTADHKLYAVKVQQRRLEEYQKMVQERRAGLAAESQSEKAAERGTRIAMIKGGGSLDASVAQSAAKGAPPSLQRMVPASAPFREASVAQSAAKGAPPVLKMVSAEDIRSFSDEDDGQGETLGSFDEVPQAIIVD